MFAGWHPSRFFILTLLGLLLPHLVPAAVEKSVFRLDQAINALESQPARWTARPGPWGVIDVKSTYIEAPPTLISLAQKPDQTPVWRFPGATVATIHELFKQAGLADAVQAALLQPGNLRAENGGITLLPLPETLLNLAPESRQVIYEALAQSPLNGFHAFPLPLPGNVDDWLLESKLSPVQRRLFKRLLWKRGACHVFSDISLLINQATSGPEITAALSSQTRVQSLVATIRIPAAASAETVLNYWRADGVNTHVLPFFRSAIGREGVSEIDLIYLLPRLARARLFTYPTFTDAVGGKLPDCHWTALNFFEINYQPYYLNDRTAFIDLLDSYSAIGEPSKLGDLICFVRADGRVAHSCVFVADDIVFTKNGEQLFSPWLLLRFPDVAAIYAYGDVNRLLFFRRKPRAAVEL